MRETMKKLLIATTALVATAGVAAAEVTLGGNGRFGLVYEDDGVTSDTFLSYRMRVNIDASTETDSGVKFGGRIRLQYDNGDNNTIEGGAELNAAMLYAEASGFRVEVGNANTAFDSLNTLYNAELGFISSTTGSYSVLDAYFSYQSSPYDSTQFDRVGIFASYSVGDLVARVSFIDPDQFNDADEEEVSVAIDYKTGPFSIGAGFASNAGGNVDYDVFAVLGEYALNDNTNIGIQFIGEDGLGVTQNDSTVTLYGNTKLASGIGLGAFVSAIDSDDPAVTDDVAAGIGASYDLGGASLAGTIQTGFFGQTYADVGVNFSF
jgi:outer membrane protein OmpU